MIEKIKKSNYERIGVLTLEEVLPHIEKKLNNPDSVGRVKINGFLVNVQSLRVRTFYHTGTDCPCCPNKASFFAVERNIGSKGGYHINLYGINEKNEEVLFTHDHILARGLGGEDNIDNSRTMCGPCNWNKGHLEGKLFNHYATEDINKKLSESDLLLIKEEIKKYIPEIKKARYKI